MDRSYYFSLTLGLVTSISLPMVMDLSDQQTQNTVSINKTVYRFEEVDGPIQPLPTKITIDKDWMVLGKALFNSPLLSKDNSVACVSCHMIDFGGDDGFPVSIGVSGQKGERNSPTVLNAVFNFKQFWDGRSNSLEDQVSGPIHNPVEMDTSWEEIIPKLNNDPYFKRAFSSLSKDGVTVDNIIKAIVVFEQSLVTPNAPIDRYVLGDKSALNRQQIRGLKLFEESGCSTCHQGMNIGGNILQKFGRIDDLPSGFEADLGRFLVTGNKDDKHVFKVPTLRNIALTAPYFHNGEVQTLSEAVQLMAKTQLGKDLSQNEVDDLVALLNSFTGIRYKVE